MLNNEGYINATEAYQKWGKSKTGFDSWKTRTLIPYATRLIELQNVSPQNEDLQSIDNLIVVNKGNTIEQGTWLHPDLVNVFSSRAKVVRRNRIS